MAGYTPYMMNPSNYGAMTPYQQQLMNQQPMQSMFNQSPQVAYSQMNQAPRQDFIGAFVNNFDEVRGYPIPIGGTVMLMEKSSNKFYMKMMDNSGNQLINTFTFEDASVDKTLDEKQTKNDSKKEDVESIKELKKEITEAFNLMHTRITKLEEQMNSSVASNKSNSKGGRAE